MSLLEFPNRQTAMHPVPDEIKSRLSAGERLLWWGRPRQGLTLRGADVFMIPFSLMWGGFAIFWEYSVLTSNAPGLFVLWGIPFVLVGLYMIFGRFLFEARQRAATFYAVTDQRIVIVSGVFARNVKSLNLRTLSDLSLSEGRGSEGTISFGAGQAPMFNGFAGWPGSGAQLAPRFELIENPRAVYDIIRAAQSDE